MEHNNTSSREAQLAILKGLTGKRPSKTVERIREDREQRPWLGHSRRIALGILTALRGQQMPRKGLAESVGVSEQYLSKVLKGRENMTLETIVKFEKALGVALIRTEFSGQMPVAEHAVGLLVPASVWEMGSVGAEALLDIAEAGNTQYAMAA